jgi:hypothetical protein
MTTGKRHAWAALICCLATWALVAFLKRELHLTGLFCALFWSVDFAKGPDTKDQDFKIIWGHRSPLMHSNILPGAASIVVWTISLFQTEFWVLAVVVAYWDISVASHLFADVFGKPSNHVNASWLIAHGVSLVLCAIGLLVVYA